MRRKEVLAMIAIVVASLALIPLIPVVAQPDLIPPTYYTVIGGVLNVGGVASAFQPIIALIATTVAVVAAILVFKTKAK